MGTKRANNILVTGGCGFIGWNFIRRLYEREYDISFRKIVNLDKMDYSAINPTHMNYYDDRYFFHKGDIKYNSFELFNRHKIDTVVHFAAQTHVDNSIKSSYKFVDTNIVGTHMLMEEARVYWDKKGIDGKFIYINTDEIYGSVEDNNGKPFDEFTQLHPNNPYSASKAAAELMLKSYIHTYKFPGIITNCSNNYGPGQHSEKLIPKTIDNYKKGIDIPIYGDGLQKRDWLYVDDHCDGIIDVLLNGVIGERYLFGTNHAIPNIDIVNTILQKCYNFYPSYISLKHVEDRKGHDRTYQIDYTKAERELGWTPKVSLETGIEKTVQWYINNTYA
jgi:dTDP-glucose 4,6-dehydratase